MLRPLAEAVDACRIWHKVRFQRGRVLTTRGSDWEAFDRPEHYADPAGFYGVNGRIPDLSFERAATTGLAEIARFSFPTLHPISAYPYRETDTATGRFYRLKGRPGAPVAVLAHGWAHDDLRPVEKIYVEPLLKAGYSVALPAHTFHLERTPAGTYSGELMVSGDVSLTVEAFRQSVADLSGLVSWLRHAGNPTVGLFGYSLGGYLAALLACARGDLDFLVVGGAGDSVISTILETGLGVNVREDLSRTGMHRRESLERAWGVISPGRLTPKVPGDRILIVAGAWDRIMLRGSVERLWERWGRPAIRWEPQGHYTLLAVPGRLVRRSLPFLSAIAGPAGPV